MSEQVPEAGEKKRAMSPLVFLPPLLFIALALMFWLGMYRTDPNALKSTREGGPAPTLFLTQLGNEPLFTDADLRAGNVVLVNFWASWCAACREEHPLLQKMADDGVLIYGIDYRDDPAKGLKYLADLGNPYARGGADPKGRTALEWGLYGVPETFVIAGDGTVVLRFAGPISERILETTIRPAMEKAAAITAQAPVQEPVQEPAQ